MVPSLDTLRADLIDRWRAAFERLPEITAEPPAEAEVVYTEIPAYALEGYSTTQFQPGAPVFGERPSGDCYTFHLDSERRPTHVRFAHSFNKVEWRGIYRYAPDEVERIEVCLGTGVPSLYERLILDGNTVVAEQRFVCNGGGDDVRLRGLTAAEKADHILGDPNGHFIYLASYESADGKRIGGLEHLEVGGDVVRPKREYAYSAGTLERVVQIWPDGTARTIFVKPSGRDLYELADALAPAIASAAMERLGKEDFAAPLVALELNYHLFDRHVPSLIPLTLDDRVASLWQAGEIPSSRWLSLDPERFVPDLTELNQRVEAGEDADVVAHMLREAARILTETCSAPLVSEDFVAFAIDWSFEGEELPLILRECGATDAQIRGWQESGWV